MENLHLILYFISYKEAKTFLGLEYEFLSEIIKHSNSKLIYIITHTDKEEIEEEGQKEEYILKINQGIENICKDKLNNENGKSKKNRIKKQNMEIKKFLFASENNCVFINFHNEKNNPVFGIKEFFEKIIEFFKLTDDYIQSNKKINENSEEYKEKINEEIQKLKLRAKDAIFWEKFGRNVFLIFDTFFALFSARIKKKLEGVFGVNFESVKKYLEKKRKYEKLKYIEENYGVSASTFIGFLFRSMGPVGLLLVLPTHIFLIFLFKDNDKLINEFAEYLKDNKYLLIEKYYKSFEYLEKMKNKVG